MCPHPSDLAPAPPVPEDRNLPDRPPAAGASGPPQRSGFGRILWATGWPARMLLTGVVKGYRLVVSPLLPPTCRFQPTCSQYALEAVRRYGAARGFVLAVWRIARCHPWGGHGYDPPRWFGEPRPDASP